MTGFFASTASRLQNRKAGALMTDPFAERQARVRAVTEANFGKVISPTRAPSSRRRLRQAVALA
jgi:hypothetical protein